MRDCNKIGFWHSLSWYKEVGNIQGYIPQSLKRFTISP